MNEMAATYASASTYADHGTVTSPLSTKTFETAFARSDRFRFEYSNNGAPKSAYVIWSDGSVTITQWDVMGKPIADRSLGGALAAATGVSSGTAHVVPRLLLPDVVRGLAVTDLAQPLLDGDEVVDGHLCWRIAGRDRLGGQYTLWIDQEKHLLRRLREFRHLPADALARRPAFDMDQTTSYDPFVNQAVTEAQLAQPDLHGAELTMRELPPWIGVVLEYRQPRIAQVTPGSPADYAGFKVGDMVNSVDGVAMTKTFEFLKLIRDKRNGASVDFGVSRAGADVRVTITLSPRPASAPRSYVPPSSGVPL